MSAPEVSVEEVVVRYLDGSLPADQLEWLNEWVKDNHEVRECLLDMALQATAVAEQAEAQGVIVPVEFPRFRPRIKWAAAAMVVIGLGAWLAVQDFGDGGRSLTSLGEIKPVITKTWPEPTVIMANAAGPWKTQKLQNGVQAIMAPNTRLTANETKGLFAKLERGTVGLSVPKSVAVAALRTPDAEITLSGAELLAYTDGQHTWLEVHRGTVTFSRLNDRHAVQVSAGGRGSTATASFKTERSVTRDQWTLAATNNPRIIGSVVTREGRKSMRAAPHRNENNLQYFMIITERDPTRGQHSLYTARSNSVMELRAFVQRATEARIHFRTTSVKEGDYLYYEYRLPAGRLQPNTWTTLRIPFTDFKRIGGPAVPIANRMVQTFVMETGPNDAGLELEYVRVTR